MKLFNYIKLLGAMTNGQQLIAIPVEPTDRQERKMLEEAQKLLAAGWSRRAAWLGRRESETGEVVDVAAEKAAFFPEEKDGKLLIPLQYLQDYLVKRIAAVQNNASIHNKNDVAEVLSVFKDYGVELTSSFTDLTFDHISWSAREGQKDKLLIHTTDATGDVVVIRFEAANELCQKFMQVALALELKPGQLFSMKVAAEDPAIAKGVAPGSLPYVNHNLTVTRGAQSHNGRPPKGQKFLQKPTLEVLQAMFRQAQAATA